MSKRMDNAMENMNHTRKKIRFNKINILCNLAMDFIAYTFFIRLLLGKVYFVDKMREIHRH